MRIADPSIYREGGTNYLVGTDQGVLPKSTHGAQFPIFASADGVKWKLLQTAAGESRLLSKDVLFGDRNFWAPHLFKWDGRYYFAYSCNSRWGIAVADRLEGPYRAHTAFMGKRSCIDPYVFFDDDKRVYAVFSDWGLDGIGLVELTEDLKSFRGNPICCLKNDREWECRPLEDRYKRLNERYGNIYHSNNRTVEGPTLMKRHGKYVLFYSANDFRSPDYCVCVAVADDVKGPWLKIQQGPVVSRDETGYNGTGHGDVFFEGSTMKYVFHIHDSGRRIHPRRTGEIRLVETLGEDGYPRYAADPESVMLFEAASER